MRRVIQRTDMKGLKGFCPSRCGISANLPIHAPNTWPAIAGRSSTVRPKWHRRNSRPTLARYAPAAYGADVVVLTDDQDVAEGTLDYAAWYKGG